MLSCCRRRLLVALLLLSASLAAVVAFVKTDAELYDTLGLKYGSSAAEVKKTYKALAKRLG